MGVLGSVTQYVRRLRLRGGAAYAGSPYDSVENSHMTPADSPSRGAESVGSQRYQESDCARKVHFCHLKLNLKCSANLGQRRIMVEQTHLHALGRQHRSVDLRVDTVGIREDCAESGHRSWETLRTCDVPSPFAAASDRANS